jgi:hypothetical protein
VPKPNSRKRLSSDCDILLTGFFLDFSLTFHAECKTGGKSLANRAMLALPCWQNARIVPESGANTRHGRLGRMSLLSLLVTIKKRAERF